jgi:hypothetical protein
MTDVPVLRGRVRDLTAGYMAGDRRSFEAFRELAALMLRLTVMAPQGGLRLTRRRDEPDRAVLGGHGGPVDPIPLNDGRWLRVSVSLALVETEAGRRMKVLKSGYQYQADNAGDVWICRYDYLREPGPDPHPQDHVQINAQLAHSEAPAVHLPRVHFPTGRVSLEALIRLLADQFGVSCNAPPETWRRALSESEATFQAIAHRPLSGPAD